MNEENKMELKVQTNISIFLSIIILICNIIIPGTGTLIVACKMKNKKIRNEFYCNALCQFLTFPLLIGWIFALIYSIIILSLSCKKIPSKDDFLELEIK